MKLIFFLIAFSILSIRVYFSWSGKERENKGESVADITIRSDHFNEEIKYSGKFELTEDETGFKSISPGGYLKYRRNEVTVKAESNLQGSIEYRIYNGSQNLTSDGPRRSFIAEAIKEMIAWGFDAAPRMERVYSKGGSYALLTAIDSLKSDPVKMLYLNRLFSIDTLSTKERALIAEKIGTLGADNDKTHFLEKFSSADLADSQIARAYFTVVEKTGSDMDKLGALSHVLELDSVTGANADSVLVISSGLGSDMDKKTIYDRLISKGLVHGARYDSLLENISLMGSDMDKMSLYGELIAEQNISEAQWIRTINKIYVLGSDMDKRELLVQIAQKMPKTAAIKESYLKAAKSITNDADYGQALRALD